MRSAHRLLLLTAAAGIVAGSVSCGDVVRSGHGPVLLVVNSVGGARGSAPGTFGVPLSSDVITNVITPAPCSAATPCPTIFDDLGQAVFTVTMKDVSVAPTANNSVTLTRYHVEFVRTDGRNTQGVDVPFAFDGTSTLTIQAGTTGTMPFELVRSSAKQESPLVQLKTNPVEISTLANITFYGTDLVGNAIQATASISVNFANFGDQ
jgi:hypothetical protein